MRFLLIFVFIFLYSDEMDLKLLKEFDIDANFVNSVYFINMKKSIGEGQIRDFEENIENGYLYIPTLRRIIKDSGVPEPFFYLAMIESGFKSHAVSGAKAAGIWQFLKNTAKLYGLRIDKYVDERRDIIKSTKAAMDYLKSLKKEFGKWYLATMAYNYGNTNLRRVLRKTKSDDINILLDPKKKYLPKETRNFLLRILRANFIAKYSKFNIDDFDNKNSLTLQRVIVPGGTSLARIADSIGLSTRKIRENNIHLNYDFTPPDLKSYYVYIPENKSQLFSKNFIPTYRNNNFYVYVVKANETLLSISRRLGVDYKDIRKFNNLDGFNVKKNQRLIIPSSIRKIKKNK